MQVSAGLRVVVQHMVVQKGFRCVAGGNRRWAPKRPPAAGRNQGQAASSLSIKPRQSRLSGTPARLARRGRLRRPRSGPPQGAAPGPGGGPGRSGSYDRPRPGGYGKPCRSDASVAKSRSERGKQGPRPPFTPSVGPRPSKSWPRASAKPSGRPGGRPSGKAGGKPVPPARFQGGRPSGKKLGA